MSDINDADTDLTRPSKRISPAGEDETKPLRLPNDPNNTILSSGGQKPPEETTQPARPASPTDPTRLSQSPSGAGQKPLTRQKRMRRQQPTIRQPRAPQPQVAPVRQHPPAPERQPARRRSHWWVWLGRLLALMSVMLILLGVLVVSGSIITYFWIASQLPPAETLRARTFQFATTQILDKNGNLLWEIIDPTGGRRTSVPIDQISPNLIKATIATEDRFFYLNVGVDPIAIARAVYYNFSAGEIVSGASTITQQLARNVLLTPQERTEQSLSRKIKEAVLAVEINRRYTKDQILEIYLNQIYYGNLAYGIEAASRTYFGKSARELSLPEAALLAGLPQSPAVHDPYVNPDGARARQRDVLRLMVEANYINLAQAEAAHLTDLELRKLNMAFEAPHFVTYVRQELETIVPPEYIYQAGLQIQTSLDPRLQAIAEAEIDNQVNTLANRNVTNGALVAVDATTGHILAMVGSKDFRDERIDGQINMAVSPRQPGSTMKPLTYLATFEQLAWTPSTLIMDIPVEFPDGAGQVYKPTNYDEKFHGPVSLRTALANSYNIPSVKAQLAIGTDALKEIAARLGITTLTRNDYGLSLTLGSGEVPLIQMTGAFQAMANRGRLVPPTTILQITDSFGRLIQPARPQPRQVLRDEHAYLITHILADNEARSSAFGPNSYLHLSRPAAAKTGTTNDFRDNWTIGYTPDIVTGVWIGNTDNTPMIDVSGLSGAGPIWYNFMERAHEGLPLRDFVRPPTIIELEVCADSGTLPSEVCPERRKEIFFEEQPPLGPEHDIHQLIAIDLNTGLRANEFCRANVEERYYRVYPPEAWKWAIEHGFEQPPEQYCPSTNIVSKITRPLDGSTVRGATTVEGAAVAANFSHFQMEFGQGTEPQSFILIQEPTNHLVEQGILGTFDTTRVENGPYTLRLLVFDQTGGVIESRVRVLVDNPIISPTPTATKIAVTPTDTPSPLPTPTATPVETPTPTPTDLAVELPSPTITPSLEPSLPTETPLPIPTSSATPDLSLPTEMPPDTPTPTPDLGAPTATPESSPTP